MKTNDEIAIEIQNINNYLRRNPFLIIELLDTKYLQASTALHIYNTYAMSPKDIYLLCYTHGITLDLYGLISLIERQKDQKTIQA